MSPHTQVNASPITKITSWLEFLGKNLHLVGCATVCGKREVMLTKGLSVTSKYVGALNLPYQKNPDLLFGTLSVIMSYNGVA